MDNYYEDIEGIRQPPNSTTAEEALLGVLLINPIVISDVSEIIEHSDFYRQSHAVIFNEMSMLADTGDAIDVISLADGLDSKGMLDQIGGFPYLVDLSKDAVSSNNAIHYAGIVKDKARQRGLLQAATDIADIAYSTELSTEEKISEAQDRLM